MKISTYSVMGTAVMLMAVSSAGFAASTNYRIIDPVYILGTGSANCTSHPVALGNVVISIPNSPVLLSAGTTTATIAGAPASTMQIPFGGSRYTITDNGNAHNAVGVMTNAGVVKVVNGVTTIHVTLTRTSGSGPTPLTADLNFEGPMGNLSPNVVVWASLTNIQDTVGPTAACPS